MAATPAPDTADEATTTATDTTSALEVLRRRPEGAELLGGFGPLVLAVCLLVVMVLLVPSVAPERTVEREVAPEGTTSEVGR